MARLQAKSFAVPDDVRTMPGVRFETVGLDDATVGHCRFEPGWRWSTEMGPLFGVSSCPIRHLGYSVSGGIHVVMDDGQTLDIGPETVFDIPPGHDKWVTGDEPWVTIERVPAVARSERPSRKPDRAHSRRSCSQTSSTLQRHLSASVTLHGVRSWERTTRGCVSS